MSQRFHVVRPDGSLGESYDKEDEANKAALSFEPPYGVLPVNVPNRKSDEPEEKKTNTGGTVRK